MKKIEARKSLVKYFTFYERKEHWIIECDTCGARWSLKYKGKEVHPGNVLALLNHTYGHNHDPQAL